MLLYLACFLVSLPLCWVLTWHVRNTALAKRWVFAPASSRHVHTAPIPRIGGVAIYLSFVTVAALLVPVSRWLEPDTQFSFSSTLRFLLPATLVFLIGLYDDIRTVGPYTKIAVEVLSGVLLFLGGFRVEQFALHFGTRTFAWPLSLLVTVLWVLLITNAFNLIDGLDGLAAGSALFSTMTVFVVSLIRGNSIVSLLSVTLAGAIIGFLRFNFNPATIFLGDSGSLFVGFLLSALALQGTQQKSSTIVAVAIPIVSLGLPLLETAISILRRFINGQPVFGADREHIHHKLLEIGFSHRGAVVLLYGVSAACGLLSLFLLHPSDKSLGIVLVVLGTGVWLGVQHLGYHEFYEIKRLAQRTIRQRHMIVNNIAIRRASEQLWKVEDYSQLCRILGATFNQNDFDGFELCLESSNSAIVQSIGQGVKLQRVHQEGNGKEDAVGAVDFNWKLTLSLLSSQSQKVGLFSLYKMSSANPLLIDINLLSTEFASALAAAVERCSSGIEKQAALGDKRRTKAAVGTN